MKRTQLVIVTGYAVMATALLMAPASADIDLPYVNSRVDTLDARVTAVEANVQQIQATEAPSASPIPSADTSNAPVATPAVLSATPVPTPVATQEPQPQFGVSNPSSTPVVLHR